MNWKYEDNRIYSEDEGEVLAEAGFAHKDNGEIVIEHVYVNPKLRGQGVGGEAMTTVADYIRKEGKRATDSCSYANSWFKKNQMDYEDVISDDLRDQTIACNIYGRHF